MKGFTQTLEKIVSPAASWLNNNKVIQAISQGLMITMPIIMVGAIASIFQNLPIAAYQSFTSSTYLSQLFTNIVNISTNMLAVYVVAAISYTYCKGLGNKDGFTCALLALMNFFLLTPTTITGEGFAAMTNLPFEWLGAKGLFTAMIVAVLTTVVFNTVVKRNWTIKLPDSVPPFVSKAFAAIIPGFLMVILFGFIAFLFSLTSYGSVHQAIYAIIQEPLGHVGNSVWTAALIYLLSGLCWFFGIHGIAVIGVVMPIWLAADAANIAALAAGQDAPNIITYTWINIVSSPGGSGATIGLIILATFFAKSQRYRSLGKLGIVPSLFYINEPVVFGFPLVLNGLMAIPFMIAPVVNILLAYGLTTLGVIPASNGVGSMGMPIFIGAFLNGGWRLLVFQIVTVFLSLAIYYPFFKIADQKEYALESDQNA
ncbi:PTS sugar transporter subunit IIC [Enterococcus casseliflavus]|nr:PTS sugar transporter subunit IIC [Enterococcus casseliflavus]